ncbi:two-component sensor histidine kinase [Asanoa ishikariensis]|uniref:histidine kinase n=1 Tax=Asanoa ishikariensis TaxID=137265 RepID=A0A1H3SAD3_9ACTN|nr:HAMP domain-containing sensor histidine kinase [Asanoa ishikariensis]GIF70262.1 two-component sensor histidine kinase [Asanoa ishikariensis]SDZ34630.1 Signal transduction histidine kinase [Asanoa ishikariensis]
MTTIVALAFLIPLGIAVQKDNREDALSDAARRSGIVAGALAVTTDPAQLGVAIEVAGGDIHVHGIEAGVKSRAAGVDIERASAGIAPVVVDVDGGALRLEPVRVGNRIAVIEVFVADPVLSGGSGQTWLLLFGIALALVVTTVIVVDRLAGRAVSAARELAAAAVGLGDGELTTRVKPSGPRELVEAGFAFNRMAERLSVTRTDEFELVADLSHRLRTPLTVLRLDADALDSDDTSIGSFSEAELDRRRTIRRIRQAIVTLEGEIDVLIKTTRKTISQDAGPGSCDASEVVRERMVFWSQLADDQNRPHRVVGAHTRIQVPVPRAELAAALDAVIGNVFRYTPQATAFEVAISRRDGYVAVRVDDAGPGIANPERALRRGASDRGSTGLGLDIAKRVTLTAHGSVSIDQAQLGGASVVMLLRDPDAPVKQVSRFGLVGRLAREPVARRRQRRRPEDD